MRLIILTVALLQSLFTITSAVITTRGELNNEKAITEFIAMDHQFLLQGLPQACVLDPIANEHICQAWKDAIFANNLQSNMSAVWRAERPAIFPSEEELAADRAWLQAERMRELKAETYAIDDSSLEKRKRKSKTTMTTQEETTTSKYHLPKPTWPLHKDPQKLEHCPCCDNERRISKCSSTTMMSASD